MFRNSIYILLLTSSIVFGQIEESLHNKWVWNADNENGTFTNPIINSDYSDPDVIRVGDKFYMTASSFNCIPGLPILESYDLVNWNLIGYALHKQKPLIVYDKVQHGNGVWAPCIRFHNKEFYIFYPDPDFGIYMTKSSKAEGPYSEPILIKSGKGLIDPSPLWDDDGRAYLVYAFAGSRAGIKSMLAMCTLESSGEKANEDDVLLFDGHEEEATIEGTKFYKRNGFYYIFAPAGGVATGWQTVLRSKNIYGPYETKKVLEQGTTTINGPHQGAWVQTKTGEDWFIHFQDKGSLGRVVHLQPMKWIDDWPKIGIDIDNNGIGEPVAKYNKPNVGKVFAKISPLCSDEFNDKKLGFQWQWHSNPKLNWGFPTQLGYYILNCIPKENGITNLYEVPNLLLQKFPNDDFSFVTKIEANFFHDKEEGGVVVMGIDYAYLKISQELDKRFLSVQICKNSDKKSQEIEFGRMELKEKTVYLKCTVTNGYNCDFLFSQDGVNFEKIGHSFQAKEGKWIGAKLGFVALRQGIVNNSGNIKIDWIRFNKKKISIK